MPALGKYLLKFVLMIGYFWQFIDVNLSIKRNGKTNITMRLIGANNRQKYYLTKRIIRKITAPNLACNVKLRLQACTSLIDKEQRFTIMAA